MNSLTNYQQALLEQAQDMWSRGLPITLHLFSLMAQEGLDVEQLEIKFELEQA